MIITINNDIFKAPINILAQIVNCQQVQGTGVALAIRKKWPQVYEDDLSTEKGDKSKLGTVRLVKVEDNNINYVANLYSMFRYGREKRHLNYEALYRCLENLRGKITNTNFVVGIPYLMGCSNAGGSWKVVEAMIKDVFDKSTIQVLICKKD